MLTKNQSKLLTMISDAMKDTGVAPTLDEMREGMGLKSKASVHRMLSCLEERGFIRKLPHKARAIEVLRLPAMDASGPTGTVYTVRRDDHGQPTAIDRNGNPFLAFVDAAEPDEGEIKAVLVALNTTGAGSTPIKASA